MDLVGLILRIMRICILRAHFNMSKYIGDWSMTRRPVSTEITKYADFPGHQRSKFELITLAAIIISQLQPDRCSTKHSFTPKHQPDNCSTNPSFILKHYLVLGYGKKKMDTANRNNRILAPAKREKEMAAGLSQVCSRAKAKRNLRLLFWFRYPNT